MVEPSEDNPLPGSDPGQNSHQVPGCSDNLSQLCDLLVVHWEYSEQHRCWGHVRSAHPARAPPDCLPRGGSRAFRLSTRLRFESDPRSRERDSCCPVWSSIRRTVRRIAPGVIKKAPAQPTSLVRGIWRAVQIVNTGARDHIFGYRAKRSLPRAGGGRRRMALLSVTRVCCSASSEEKPLAASLATGPS